MPNMLDLKKKKIIYLLKNQGSQFEADLYLTGLYSSALDVLYRFMKQFGYSFDSSRDLGPKPVAQRALDYLHSVCSNQVHKK